MATAVRTFSMPKALCIFGAAIALLLVLVFGADLALGVFFGGAGWWVDGGFIACGAALGYLSWSTLREQT